VRPARGCRAATARGRQGQGPVLWMIFDQPRGNYRLVSAIFCNNNNGQNCCLGDNGHEISPILTL
jgi:hypothetical protein